MSHEIIKDQINIRYLRHTISIPVNDDMTLDELKKKL